MENKITLLALKPSVCLSLLIAGLIAGTATAHAQEDREPASAAKKRPPVTDSAAEARRVSPPVESDETTDEDGEVISSRRTRSSEYDGPRSPRFQFSLVGGPGLNSSDDLSNKYYQHQTSRSPVLRLGFHFAFFSNRRFNLLLGGTGIYVRSVDTASGASGTATYTSNNYNLGPTVGVGWSPGGAGAPFQLQALVGTGFNVSHSAQLDSPGFSTSVSSNNAGSDYLAFWFDLFATYQVAPNWRLLGGYTAVAKTNSLLAGAAYVF